MQLAWENSPHFATPPVVCPRNDVWENSAEIPYWWRALARSEISFWLVANLLHLIGSSTQISVHNGISALVSQTSFRGETTGSVVKCRLFSHATMQQVSWNCVKYYAIFYKGNTSFFFCRSQSLLPPLPILCTASFQAFSVNAFWRRGRDKLRGNKLAQSTWPKTHTCRPHRMKRPTRQLPLITLDYYTFFLSFFSQKKLI